MNEYVAEFRIHDLGNGRWGIVGPLGLVKDQKYIFDSKAEAGELVDILYRGGKAIHEAQRHESF